MSTIETKGRRVLDPCCGGRMMWAAHRPTCREAHLRGPVPPGSVTTNARMKTEKTMSEWKPNMEDGIEAARENPDNAGFVAGYHAGLRAAKNAVQYHSTGRKDAAAKVDALHSDSSIEDALMDEHIGGGGCQECEEQVTRFDEADGGQWCDICAPGGPYDTAAEHAAEGRDEDGEGHGRDR